VEVEILDFGFNPQIITVPVGTTVTWPNLDPVEHTVTSDTFVFDSSLAFNETFSYTFTEPGTYPYSCTIHDFMFGRVIVE
jgi:plastocyanin